jgi:uncharacterized protein with PIN domain
VPHAEIDLVLIDGESVDFARRLRDGNRVAVYPVFERFDMTPLTRLRPRPLRRTRFVLDVHLGTLARYLRLLGFDTIYRNDYDDHEIVRLAHDQSRIILTRDKGLLKHAAVTRGRWIRHTRPLEQLRETLVAFDLAAQCPAVHALRGVQRQLRPLARRSVASLVPARVRERHDKLPVAHFAAGSTGLDAHDTHPQGAAGRVDRPVAPSRLSCLESPATAQRRAASGRLALTQPRARPTHRVGRSQDVPDRVPARGRA